MQDRDDNDLLREYVEHDSQEAFAALVARHVNMVYSVAWRHTRNSHQAEEITQAVFVILAKKSRTLAKSVILSGWLYQTARLASVTLVRSEIRRASRQQEALMQTLANENETDTWLQIAPLLDEAIADLNERDRHAVVLRFFDQKSMKEVGDAMDATEHAAKKRVTRAVEKLQKYFSRRGVNSTTSVIVGAISTNAVQVAPGGLAKVAAALAITKGAAAGGSTLTLIHGVLKIMAWSKAQTAIALGIGALLLGTGAYQTHRAAQLSAENQIFEQQQAQLSEQVRKMQRERDEAVNLVTSQTDAAAQNQRDNSELLKLRGEVAQLRPLQQQLAQLKSSPHETPSDGSTNEVTEANKIMFDFLGTPASAPPNLNRAYTKEGLLEGMQLAAQNAGVVLKKIEIDDSEFPPLVGVECEKGDYPKLKEQINKMQDYEYSGSVGGDTYNAMNMIPPRMYSGKSSVDISRRLMVRQQMLYNKISGQQ